MIKKYNEFIIKENREHTLRLKNCTDELYSYVMKELPELDINTITISGKSFEKILTPITTIPKGSEIRVNISTKMNGERYYNLTLDFTEDGVYIKTDKTKPESDIILGEHSDNIFNIIKKYKDL